MSALELLHARTLVANTDPDGGWQDRGLCTFLPPEGWERTDHPDVEALRICLACPVRQQCGDCALTEVTDQRDDFLIRAATTPTQRHRIRQGVTTLAAIWATAQRHVARHDAQVHAEMLPAMDLHHGQVAA